ncbi:MAG: beta family protein [Thermanaeromonas sp.]|uniref:beta family protein n=1 Tax=Thermanaeromonas sp. TaxID=2003697 RepID=UPI00243E6A8C|nr:beta family protein [Thermanaeromonas sp.]MCG0278210.1 beta family protein [Thermanaeromonas sp.]
MPKLYVPILKWKEGERVALRWLSEEVKNNICPVINVMKDTKPDSFASEVIKNWGEGRQFYLDFHPTFPDDLNDFVEAVLAEPESSRLAIIPVISASKPPEYFQLIRENAHLFTNGIALRVGIQDLENTHAFEEGFCKEAGIDKQSIDLIVDLGGIVRLPQEVIKSLAAFICFVLTQVRASEFRNVIVAGASFPESLNVPQNKVSILPRKEWILWKEVYDKHSYAIFGDYGPDDPEDEEYEHGITIIPTIRYTYGDSWHIVRGVRDPRNPYDYTQFHGLSQTLVKMTDIFCGKDFSWGDMKIYECANRVCTGSSNCNHGNMRSWVPINTNHHLTYVTHQVSMLVSS